mgnify:CR=1 FL=1
MDVCFLSNLNEICQDQGFVYEWEDYDFANSAILYSPNTEVAKNILTEGNSIECFRPWYLFSNAICKKLNLKIYPKNQFDAAYIEGADNFEFQGTFTHKWNEDAPSGPQDAYKALLGENLNRKVVVYCGGNKCGRSNTAALWAKELGYHHVFRMTSGIKGWQDAGYPIKTTQK